MNDKPKQPRRTDEPLKRACETLRSIAAILATKSESEMSESEVEIAELLIGAGIVQWHHQSILIFNN